MAEIEIKPKDDNKGGFNWLWILAIAALAGLLIWFLTRDNDVEPEVAGVGAIENTAEAAGNEIESAGEAVAAEASEAWESIDLDAPTVIREEVTIASPDFEMRGTDTYTIYSIGEDLLFETDKAMLQSSAKEKLDQIAASIKQRYDNGMIRVYGYTDARAGAQYNKQLSEERAEAVKNWLVENGNVDASRISIQPMGEANPEATNQTAAGRQQNRRVEIVAMNP